MRELIAMDVFPTQIATLVTKKLSCEFQKQTGLRVAAQFSAQWTPVKELIYEARS